MTARPKAKDYIKSLSSDVPASIVVFLVALPLCLGVALASGAPLFSGIIAGVVGGIVVGFASRSHLSVSGPAAGLTTIVLAAITQLQSFEAFLMAVVLCGVFQLCLGFLKAGIIGDYVPNGVIKGMLAAIGLILIIGQIPVLLGDPATAQQGVQEEPRNMFTALFYSITQVNPAVFLIGAVCLLFHIVWDKMVAKKKGFLRLVPAPLLIVFLAAGINYLYAAINPAYVLKGGFLVSIPVAASAGEFFSFFTTPDWSAVFNTQVLVIAVTLSLVASLESLLSIEAVDDLDPYQRVTPTNRELKAQGIGNIISGLIGGIPVTSVIVRSSANVNSGAKTKMSTIYHGTWLLLSVAFIPFLLNLIPKTALAAILIYIGYKLARPALFKAYYKKGWDQFLPFVITIAAILATDLLKGVIIGIGVGLFFVMRSNFRKSVFVVHCDEKYLFRLRKDVSFLNKAIIRQKLETVPEGSKVIIDARRADFIDKDVVEVIEDFMLHAPLNNIDVDLQVSSFIDHGFSYKILNTQNRQGDLVRRHDKSIKQLKLQPALNTR